MKLKCVILAAAVLLAPAFASEADERTPERVRMIPDDSVDWGLRNVGAGITSVFGLWNYWYKKNFVTIETVPANARLDLYFIRFNFQKLFVRTEAPVEIELPSRIMSTRKDALIVRVAANGYKTLEQTFDVPDVPKSIVISLDPLPNSLVFLGHSHLAGRTTISMRTTKEPELRLLKSRTRAGFTVSLSETADAREKTEAVSGGLLDEVIVSQIGEDLVVQFSPNIKDVEARSKHTYDPVRKQHVYTFDLMREGSVPPSFDGVRRELDSLRFAQGAGCNRAYEAVLRDRLDPEVVARAFRPSGSIADVYRREAMKRLGRLDHGTVETTTGERLRTGSPIELEMALQTASSVRGCLALLGAFARTEPDPETALRSLVAPDLSREEFAGVYAEAEAACRR